jgi:putative ABC transport system permease protein
MLHLALQGVRHNKGRYVATLVAIITGVAFFAAAGFLSDRVIESLEGDVNREFGAVDAAVVPDDSGEEGGTFAETLRLDDTSYQAIAETDGVEGAAGILTGSVAFLDDDGTTTYGDGATGRLWIADDELNPLSLDEGTAPQGAGEITVDRGLAEDEGLAVGDDVTVLTLAGPFPASIVGITSFGDSDSIDQSGTVTMPEATAFDWLAAGQVEYEEVFVRGSGDEAALVDALEPAAPDGFVAQTGEEFLADQRSESAGFGAILKRALQFFALLAMFVGAFVIYNTFNVIVTQRLKELAVLAAIGATPKQIKRSLRFEGLVIGLVGSALGVVVGFFLTFALIAVLDAIGISLPGSGLVVHAGTIVQPILIGTVITFLAVNTPARKASRTEPIEAMRDAAVESTAISRRRIIATSALMILGAANLLLGSTPAAVGIGALLLFIGVILAGPLIAILGSKILRRPLSLLGLEGRLAVDNTARNPQRTATTANALLIGVFLVTLVTIAGTSVKDFAVGEIQKLESADYFIFSDGGTIDQGLVGDLEAVPDVQSVVSFRTEAVTIDGTPGRLSAGDLGAMSEIAALNADEGSLDDVVEGTIAVPSEVFDAGMGDTVTIANTSGEQVELTVVAVLEPSLDAVTIGSLVATDTLDELVGDTAPVAAFVDIAAGAATDTEDAIDEIAALRPDLTVQPGNQLGQLISTVFDFIINAVNGLLLMSVLVALIGIVNTLSLSILERRRELGLLRVIGMVDKRVQRMVLLESVLIATMGTVSGLLLGALVAFGMIHAINGAVEEGVSVGFSLPWGMLGIVLVFGIGLGLLASWIPSRRSTKLDVLDALQAT